MITRTRARWMAAAPCILVAAVGLASDHPAKPGAAAKLAAAAPVKHVVWATGGRWIYGDARSGAGERNPLRLSAAPGDLVEFRQSHGQHRVFFYVTPPEESELGERIVVDKDFEVVGDRPRLERLPTRIFRRANLATPPAEGRTTVVTIRLKPDFRRPLYFGSFEPTPGGGSEPFFGAIYPRLGRAPHARKLPPADFRFADPQRVARPNRIDWERGLVGAIAPSVPPTVQVIRGNKFLAVPPRRTDAEGIDVTAQWFQGDVSRYSPAEMSWYFATAAELNRDRTPEVVAAVAPKEGKAEWVTLFSNAAEPRVRMVAKKPAEAMRFVRAVPVAPGPATAQAGRRAFAVAADFNNDGRADLLLYNGAGDGTLQMALNRPAPRASQQDSPSAQFQLNPPLVPHERFGLKEVYLVFPFDADFDGWTDLLVVAAGRDAVILFNQAPGEISGRDGVVLPDTAFAIQEVGLQDLDGDGRSDLILRGPDGRLRAFFNNGERDFATR